MANSNIINSFRFHSSFLKSDYQTLINKAEELTTNDKNFRDKNLIDKNCNRFKGALYEKYLLLAYLKCFCDKYVYFTVEQNANFPDFIVKTDEFPEILALEITRVTNSGCEASLKQFNQHNQINKFNKKNFQAISYDDLLFTNSPEKLKDSNKNMNQYNFYNESYHIDLCVAETCNMLGRKIDKFNAYCSKKHIFQYNVILLNIERIFSEGWDNDSIVDEYFTKLSDEINKNDKIKNWLKLKGQAVISIEWADKAQQEKHGEISFYTINYTENNLTTIKLKKYPKPPSPLY